MRQLVLNSMPNKRGIIIITAKEKQYNYLVNVLRFSKGDIIEVRLPDGSLEPFEVYGITPQKKELVLKIYTLTIPQKKQTLGKNQPAIDNSIKDFPEISLFQWLLKGQKMDLVIRQATETGIKNIFPILGERCFVNSKNNYSHNKKQRWQRIIQEAMQQSGSPIKTSISEPLLLSEISSLFSKINTDNDCEALVFTESSLFSKSLHEHLKNNPKKLVIAIGPEGGMSKKEISFLLSQGFSMVHLNTNILRAETASLYSIAAVQTILLESKKWQLKE